MAEYEIIQKSEILLAPYITIYDGRLKFWNDVQNNLEKP